jgi:hypothetical protein
MKLTIAVTNTLAAAMSLILPACSWKDGEMKSTVFSIAVFIISVLITAPQQAMMMHQSVELI